MAGCLAAWMAGSIGEVKSQCQDMFGQAVAALAQTGFGWEVMVSKSKRLVWLHPCRRGGVRLVRLQIGGSGRRLAQDSDHLFREGDLRRCFAGLHGKMIAGYNGTAGGVGAAIRAAGQGTCVRERRPARQHP